MLVKSASSLVLALVLGIAASAPAAIVTFNVDDAGEGADAGGINGVCHTDTNTCTLLAALQEATAGSTANTYVIHLTVAATYTVSATFPDIARTITIRGGGAATYIIKSSNVGRPLLFNVVAGGNLTLDKVTIENAGHHAIVITDASGTISNSMITGNAQGAVMIDTTRTPGSLVLASDTFSNNVATNGPGALEVSFANLTATDVVFSGNTGTAGNAVYIHGSDAYTQSFSDCAFNGNSGAGSALNITAPKVTIDTTTFEGNTSTTNLYGGGAISAGGVSPGTRVTNSTFHNNKATNASGGNGGAIMVINVLVAQGCTFSNNQSTAGYGGAVFAGANDGAQFACVDCTFNGNSAAGGGAIAVGTASGTVELSNVTISGNTATDTAAHNFGGGGTWGRANARNTIIAGNTAADSPDCQGTLHSGGFDLIGNSTGCTITGGTGDHVGTAGNPINPHLSALGGNGGPTDTMALQATSPAGDAGDPSGCKDHTGAPITQDQRGQPRVVDGNNDGVTRCDIGAYEAPKGTFPTPTTTTSSTTSTSTTHQAGTSSTTTTHTVAASTTSTTVARATTSTTAIGSTSSTTLPPASACGGCAIGDPNCCDQTAAMVVKKAVFTQTHPSGGFSLRATLASSGFTGIDPRQSDVILELAGANGDVLCAVVPHALWRSKNGKAFTFTDKAGRAASGVMKAKVTVNKKGAATLVIKGAGLDPGSLGTSIEVRSRIGGRCSERTIALKTKKKKLVFP